MIFSIFGLPIPNVLHFTIIINSRQRDATNINKYTALMVYFIVIKARMIIVLAFLVRSCYY